MSDVPNDGFRMVSWQQADCLFQVDEFMHVPLANPEACDRASDILVILNNCIRNTRTYRDNGPQGHLRTAYLANALPILEKSRRDVLKAYEAEGDTPFQESP